MRNRERVMKKIPAITETEWKIMKVVWERGSSTAQQIVDALMETDKRWHPKTAKTLLNRLVRKNALGFRKEGRAYIYRPLVNEQECVGAETESFLDRVFGGSLKPMVAHFVEKQKLSRKEIRELKALLDQKEEK